MGWLFGYHTRKELIEHLIFGNGVKTLRHCLKGNNLWAVHEMVYEQGPHAGETARFVVLYMLRGGDKEQHRWGYKDVDGDSGPNYVNCPLSYLDGLSEATSYGVEWRERVRRYWAARGRKLKSGMKIRLYGNIFDVGGEIKGGYFIYSQGVCSQQYRLKRSQMEHVEVLT